MSFTAKPYSAPGKSASLPRFNPEGNMDQGKSRTLPTPMPTFSGDILKQRLAAMQNKSGQTPLKKKPPPNPTAPSPGPLISEKELKVRRDSMHRTPAPPTPDSKQKYDKTPEFLRKRLKPTGLPQKEVQEEENYVQDDKEKEPVKDESKKNFRNSKLLFENISAAPKVTPKPATRPKPAIKPREVKAMPQVSTEENLQSSDDTSIERNSDVNHSLEGDEKLESLTTTSEENRDQLEIHNASTEALNQLDKILDSEEGSEGIVLKDAKPQDIKMPEAPNGLDLWMKHFVRNNAKLAKLDSGDAVDAPPIIKRELKHPTLSERALAPSSKEVTPAASEEIYDDVVAAEPAATTDEIYDDVAGESTQVDESSGLVQDELYDDVIGANQEGQVSDELYDDVAGTAQADDNQDVYDDVAGSASEPVPLYEVEEGETGEQAGDAVYEPVETISHYVTNENIPSAQEEKPSKGQTLDKVNKKKEEKGRKEREKIEKRKREEAEKQKKKDEEEKKKKEREERKRVEKERKLFNLKPDEVPVPTERHVAQYDFKGKGKELAVTRGEYLDVISTNNCPRGKALVQNSSGKLGYVQLNIIGMDKRMSLLMAASPVATGVAFGGVEEDDQYDDVCGISANGFSSEIVSLSSNSATNGSTKPTFGQSRGVFQFGQSTPKSPSSTGSNEGENGDDLYEQL